MFMTPGLLGIIFPSFISISGGFFFPHLLVSLGAIPSNFSKTPLSAEISSISNPCGTGT